MLLKQELKKCPYCKAGEPQVQYRPSKHKKYPWRVICSNCWARTDWCRLMSGAVDSWNMRDGVLTDVPTPFEKDTNVPGKPFWDSWIDAKDRLPKKQFTAVLCIVRDKTQHSHWYFDLLVITGGGRWKEFGSQTMLDPDLEVTHWTPLPRAPQEVSEDAL